MERVAGPPEMVLDGAHNRASMERLVEGIARHFPGRRQVVVFGAAADKDVDGMLAALVEKWPGAAIVFTRTASPRAADPADLVARFAKQVAAGDSTGRGGGSAAVAPDAATALAAAARLAGRDGLVVVCGSLYLVGEVKRLLLAGRSSAKAGG
jgi:dihydrofolate synthase/folylpolyglutamate synthase